MAKASQFLKIIDQSHNQVEGECYDEKHLREIDIKAWSWGVEDPAAPKMGPKSDEGVKSKGSAERESDRKPSPAIFEFSKATDRSTTRLLGAMDKGEIFQKVVLTVEEQYKESPMPFHLEVEMTEVFVVDFKWRANAEGAGMSFDEDWQFNYSDISFSYKAPRGVIPAHFNRPPDSTEGASKKAPKTAAEKEAEERERFDKYQQQQKKGLKK